MKLISTLPILLLTLGTTIAEELSATDLLKRIDQEKPIKLTNTTINGNLDFTQLERKTRGGSYGGRVGRVKEFFTKLRAPLMLEHCTINGDLITYS
jgi:hypothetical protein